MPSGKMSILGYNSTIVDIDKDMIKDIIDEFECYNSTIVDIDWGIGKHKVVYKPVIIPLLWI